MIEDLIMSGIILFIFIMNVLAVLNVWHKSREVARSYRWDKIIANVLKKCVEKAEEPIRLKVPEDEPEQGGGYIAPNDCKHDRKCQIRTDQHSTYYSMHCSYCKKASFDQDLSICRAKFYNWVNPSEGNG